MGEGNVEFHHISVMLEETVKGLVTNKEGIYVDCTLGGAGHSHRGGGDGGAAHMGANGGANAAHGDFLPVSAKFPLYFLFLRCNIGL